MKLDDQQLTKLKVKLPKHYAKTVASSLQVSVAHVYNVLSGKSDDVQVLEALLTLAEKTEAKKVSVNRKVSAL